MKKDELFTTAPAAKFLNRSEQTIQNWAKCGKLPFITASRLRLFRRADLEKVKEELERRQGQ